MRHFLLSLFIPLAITLSSCDRNNNFVMMAPEEDAALGKQLSEQILSQPEQYQVLDPDEYPESYAYLRNIVQTILESGEVVYKEEFPWKVYIVKDDQTLNAFATPGGYIFVYTGLIKFLEKESDLAGVIGHEIAHADLRHASRQIQKAQGLNFVLSLILGENNNALGEIAAQLAGHLAGLQFSREYEQEADARSVEYLAQTSYPCSAAASFFQKLQQEEKQGRTPTFLSTHPSPENRVKEILAHSQQLGCDTTSTSSGAYQEFQNSLP
ncbi:M48 family metalloprotease [Nafulsella turpanensis]|uniref:M48 family metalloprotease n=1 Tax=Nafulsella turpanensis TaxID=1265690 RepID=UPI00034D571A|nr:M48 family metalloprotease [Nafulsella turpanensis]